MKKFLTKTLLHFSTIRNISSSVGYLKIYISDLKKVPEKYRDIDKNVIPILRKLPGITELTLIFSSGEITINYENEKIGKNQLLKWFRTLWNTMALCFSDINDESKEKVIELLEEQLHKEINKIMNNP